jgi:hypothetical protein
MCEPTKYVINDTSYYKAFDLRKYDPAYFVGCTSSIRRVIKRKSIPEESYIYGNISKLNGWSLAKDKTKPNSKAILLFDVEWCKNNVPFLMDDQELAIDNYDYPPAPDELILEEDEMFKDDEGNVLEIETIGERTSKGIYFKAKDVSKGFNILLLKASLLNKNTEYIRDVHFKTFSQTKYNNDYFTTTKKTLYISYKGMLKVLFCSRNNKTTKFIDWATETLFTVQMGTVESKVKLIKELGVHSDDMKQCLKASTQKMSCVYLLGLGTVEDLRDVFDIDDNIDNKYIICKFGRGTDLQKRLGQHDRDYGRIKGVNISVIKYAYIDPEYITEAELCVSHIFDITENKLSVSRRKELIFINPKNLKFVEEYFVSLQKRFIGSYANQVAEVDKLNIIIKSKDNDIENLKIINQKDLEIKDKTIENVLKDLEIEKMKNLLLRNNINI